MVRCRGERRRKALTKLLIVAPAAASALKILLIAALCIVPAREMRANPPDVLVECPIDGDNAPLMLPIEIVQGADFAVVARALRPLKMVLDTGSSISVFDKTHADSLGEVKEARACRSATGTIEYRAFSGPEMRIGTCSVRAKGDVACFDLGPVRESFKRDIDGLLGMDVLSLFVIAIDFDERTIRLHRSVPPDAGRAITLYRNDDNVRNCMFAKAAIDGEESLDFLIDTGAAGPNTGSLDDDVFDRYVEAGTLRPAGPLRPVFGASGTALAAQGRAGGFTLGGYRHAGAVFHRLNSPSSLGLYYLSRYKVVFDFPNRTMYLKPGRSFDRVDICDRLGLTLRRANQSIEVKATVPGGAAAKAGIQAGDILRMLDGADVKPLKLRDVRRTLSTDGAHVLELSRGGKQLRITVRDENVFAP